MYARAGLLSAEPSPGGQVGNWNLNTPNSKAPILKVSNILLTFSMIIDHPSQCRRSPVYNVPEHWNEVTGLYQKAERNLISRTKIAMAV